MKRKSWCMLNDWIRETLDLKWARFVASWKVSYGSCILPIMRGYASKFVTNRWKSISSICIYSSWGRCEMASSMIHMLSQYSDMIDNHQCWSIGRQKCINFGVQHLKTKLQKITKTVFFNKIWPARREQTFFFLPTINQYALAHSTP